MAPTPPGAREGVLEEAWPQAGQLKDIAWSRL